MGSAFDICETCFKENENDNFRSSYFIDNSNTSAPQTLIDIKVNAKNFVVQRTKSVFCNHCWYIDSHGQNGLWLLLTVDALLQHYPMY